MVLVAFLYNLGDREAMLHGGEHQNHPRVRQMMSYLIQPTDVFWQQYEQAEGPTLIVKLKADCLWLFYVKNGKLFFHRHHLHWFACSL